MNNEELIEECEVVGRFSQMQVWVNRRRDPKSGISIHYEGGERCKSNFGHFLMYRRVNLHMICSIDVRFHLDSSYHGGNCHIFIYHYGPAGCG
mmetsp:Transcript_19494/g.3189  ORF Transcript_19494/g.3189 Transcript_19494/m.3189 type:complete len:93 (+) Transcript_19494:204-482(+)